MNKNTEKLIRYFEDEIQKGKDKVRLYHRGANEIKNYNGYKRLVYQRTVFYIAESSRQKVDFVEDLMIPDLDRMKKDLEKVNKPIEIIKQDEEDERQIYYDDLNQEQKSMLNLFKIARSESNSVLMKTHTYINTKFVMELGIIDIDKDIKTRSLWDELDRFIRNLANVYVIDNNQQALIHEEIDSFINKYEKELKNIRSK